ncbi:MAG: hypothetical protein DRG76_05260 [Deltaproteobacteria bacterium]|nr:MAG: hypothetical protein DRG76_05260 [Deltaproteobacteria bacterium]
MSIRMIAKDLYRLQKEVERLERELAHCLPEKRAELEAALREAKAERDKARQALEGIKEPPPYRKPW